MRLKKDEKKRYKQTIKDSMTEKVINLNTAHDIKWTWRELKDDHMTKLRLDLDHIAKYPLLDALEADCIEGETLFNTKCYFKHYSDWEIKRLLTHELPAAKSALAYLEKLAMEEADRRKSKMTQKNPQAGTDPAQKTIFLHQ